MSCDWQKINNEYFDESIRKGKAVSLLTQAYVLENFGLRLNIGQLAKLLDIKEGTIRNQISAGAFPIATYTEGARRFASYQAVSQYLDNQHLITRRNSDLGQLQSA